MRRLCALLAEELLRWPDVRFKPMFGMRAFYRGAVIFAMLPDKRAFETPWSVAYKLPDKAAKREGLKWQLFELKEERDIDGALGCLQRAYLRAKSAQ
ncbi:hypothetical protein SBA3_140007 [Candidatus Sulfopaludibacter sp. SbA3]|nr:hypothetical protein SBA3_140007 [Candidatus Sulfopaludibacter sp. SbA3]